MTRNSHYKRKETVQTFQLIHKHEEKKIRSKHCFPLPPLRLKGYVLFEHLSFFSNTYCHMDETKENESLTSHGAGWRKRRHRGERNGVLNSGQKSFWSVPNISLVNGLEWQCILKKARVRWMQSRLGISVSDPLPNAWLARCPLHLFTQSGGVGGKTFWLRISAVWSSFTKSVFLTESSFWARVRPSF